MLYRVGSGLVNYSEHKETLDWLILKTRGLFLRCPVSDLQRALVERDAAGARSHGSKDAIPRQRTFVQLGIIKAGNQEVLINSVGEKKRYDLRASDHCQNSGKQIEFTEVQFVKLLSIY
ncbi:uncharacterized protein LOC112583539 isoform X1 [Bubalus bubalis]|uniref:uncharacterized protein LOC112583539 isoform X1 n=2 Tax=Bubalus bubalis TaxID=89462 RepID=UPI001E1B62A8|nr:uncharacterized protein LOC112583539 isoform X1 [Bubalus bubalis]